MNNIKLPTGKSIYNLIIIFLVNKWVEILKYAVYVRVSTDRDEQVSSVENQIDICRYWLEKRI